MKLPVPNTSKVLDILKQANEALSPLSKPLGENFDVSSAAARYNAVLATTMKRIDAVIAAIKGEPPPSLPAELYEIIQEKGAVKLKKVQL